MPRLPHASAFALLGTSAFKACFKLHAAIAIAIILLAFGFEARARIHRPELRQHVVAADYDGVAVDPENDNPYKDGAAFKRFVDGMFKAAEALASEKGEKVDGRLRVKILVHVHGGLNAAQTTAKRVETLSPAIMNEPRDWYYPIFVRWPSSFPSTYWEHLVSVRQGNKAPVWGPITSPFVFATDIIQSVAHAPVDWFYQGLNAKDRAIMKTGPASLLSPNWKIAEFHSAHENVRLSSYHTSAGQSLTRSALGLVELPLQLSIGTLGQSTLAQSSWKNMNRRTTQVIYPAGLIEKTEAVDEVRATSAGYFFKLLNERAIQCARGSQFKYEIYLFGHSMGAIVLNKAFTEYRADWIESGAIKEIAYMAAACSVADGLNALKPLLLAYNTNGSPLLFHNLTLNRVAEIAEPTAFGVAPSGSLLEYIDQHLESPDSAVDRTLGSEVNVLPAIHVFDGIQQYCRFKGFDRFPHTLPTKHSDFNKVPFWLPEFWDPSTKTAHGNSYPSDWLEHYQPARALPLHLRPAKR